MKRLAATVILISTASTLSATATRAQTLAVEGSYTINGYISASINGGPYVNTYPTACTPPPTFTTVTNFGSLEALATAQANQCLAIVSSVYQAAVSSCPGQPGGDTSVAALAPWPPLSGYPYGGYNTQSNNSFYCGATNSGITVAATAQVFVWACNPYNYPVLSGTPGQCSTTPSSSYYYVAASPPLQAQTSSPDNVAEPINPSLGNVYSTETDVQFAGPGGIAFRRYYNSADTTGADGVTGWRHSYDRSISTIYQTTSTQYPGQSSVVSPQYATQQAACTSGFPAIRAAVSAWANATATYSDGVCVLANGTATIGTLAIQTYPAPQPPLNPVEYDVIRDDGQTLRYTLQNGIINNPPGVSVRLAVTASGFTVTDDQDRVETYNSFGVLQSITSRAGVVQTVSYTNGLWSGVTDSFGNFLSVSRNAQGSIGSIVTNGGGTAQYLYDFLGRLSTVTNLDSTTRNYLYGNPNLYNALTGVVDESGVTVSTWDYDSLGRATSTSQAVGANAMTLGYNADGSVTTTDVLGAVRTFNFTRIGDVNQVTSISGSQCPTCQDSAGTTYDAAGWVASRTDYDGNLTCYANDPVRGLELYRVEGFAPGSTCPADLATYVPAANTVQRKIATVWSTSFRLPMSITQADRMTSFSYDGFGNPKTKTITDTTVTPAVSRTWTYTYYNNGLYGQVQLVTGPRTDISTDVTSYTYYDCTTGSQCGRVNTVTSAPTANALGGLVTTFLTYNTYGQALTYTDPNGVLTTLTYDSRQRLRSRLVSGETTSLTYWPTGVLQSVALPDASSLQFSYDAAHRLTDITDGVGNHVHYGLDGLGNHTSDSIYDPNSVLSRSHTRVFDTLGRLYQDIGAANTAAVTTTFEYDGNGNPVSVNAPLGRNTSTLYDDLNRITQITDPASGLMQLGYDANNNITSVTDPGRLQTTYSHNGFGDLTQIVAPDTGTTQKTYDSAGNLQTSTDARGTVATYTHDALNRLTSSVYQTGGATDQTITYTFDSGTNGKGHLTGASDANHSMAWSYDPLGRITGKAQIVAGVTMSVGYSYTNGDETTLVTPSGQQVIYSYANHQITGITVNSTAVLSSASYEPFGPIRGWTWGNGTTEVRLHNTDGNPSLLTGIEAVSISYDNAFRILGINNATNSTLSWTYGYDALDRLTSASKSGTTLSWQYDANGNRVQQSGDQSANVLSIPGTLFTFNGRGRMSAAKVGSTTTNYVYNALGQLIEKSVGGTATLLVYDEANHLIGEYSGTGTLIQETIWLGDVPIATIRPNGGTVSIDYVHANQLGAPIMVTQPSNNAILWRWDTDPFGAAVPNQNPQSLGTFVYNLRFPGQYYQAETGLNYNSFRDYDAASGRYRQSDPVGLQGGSFSTYAYARGNPIGLADALGLSPPGQSPGASLSAGDQSGLTMAFATLASLIPAIDNAFEGPEAAALNLAATQALVDADMSAASEGPSLASLASQIQGNVPLSAQTISVIETVEGLLIVTGNGAGLSGQQIALAQELGLTPGMALGDQFHAEINGLYSAGEMGLTPTNGVTTNPVCMACINQISSIASQGGYQLQLTGGGKAFTFMLTGGP